MENKTVFDVVIGKIIKSHDEDFSKVLDELSSKTLHIYCEMLLLSAKYVSHQEFTEWALAHPKDFDAFHCECIKAAMNCKYDSKDYKALTVIDNFLWDVSQEIEDKLFYKVIPVNI